MNTPGTKSSTLVTAIADENWASNFAPPLEVSCPVSLTEVIDRQNKLVLVSFGIVLLTVAVIFDTASGPELETSVLYLLPVSFFAAFLGRTAGITVSIVAAGLALFVHRAHFPYSRISISYWNALIWLAVYLLSVLMVCEIRHLYRRERVWSRADTLTGIPNRRAFLESLEAEKDRARRYLRPLTLAYIDLDRFKDVNDSFGHKAGDTLLGSVASVLKQGIRTADVVARLGGDEFAVMLPETDGAAAITVLSKLHLLLNSAMKQANWPVTFSIGMVTFQPPPQSVEAIVDAADEAMYCAKQSGGDRLVFPSTR